MNISTDTIKELRSRTGAGILDCKKALQAADGHLDKAIESLRKKGLAFAEKKSSRITTEGVIETYVHAGSRIGVIVELNCETDFVARQNHFKVLAKDIAMQLAACQSVEYVAIEKIPEHIIDNERRIESSKEDIMNKPQVQKDKIIQGRIQKKLKELSLMSQPFIKDNSISIEELIKQHIALLGENILIRRFERFILGDGLQKKSDNFVQEVSEMANQ